MSETKTFTICDEGYSLLEDNQKRHRIKDLVSWEERGEPPPKLKEISSRPGGRLALTLSDGRTELVKPGEAGPATLFCQIRRLLTLAPEKVPGAEGALGALEGAAVLVIDGKVAWVGREQDFDPQVAPEGYRKVDLGGALCLPGLVDPHTHLVFAGERGKEYGLRQKGASYVEILEAGGGILSTVEATRAASHEELYAAALPRLRGMLRRGVTTCEAKSGYGLNLEDELKILEVIQRLDASQPIDLVPTLLAAHAIPKEWRDNREGYIRLILEEILPRVVERKLATSFDVFCDRGAFTLPETRALLTAAREAGLAVRVHAEEIELTGAAALAAEMGALSADHLEKIDEAGIQAMAKSGTVAVLLPGTAVTLGLSAPPIAALLRADVPLAIGTDLNPGSCYLEDLPLAAALGCGLFRLDVERGILAITKHAARAVGLSGQAGEVSPGAKGDLVAYDAPGEEHLFYRFGQVLPSWVIKSGRVAVRPS